jgi:hypothetical protein
MWTNGRSDTPLALSATMRRRVNPEVANYTTQYRDITVHETVAISRNNRAKLEFAVQPMAVKYTFSSYTRPLKPKKLHFFETSATDYPLSQHHTLKEWSSKPDTSIVRTRSATDIYLFVDKNIRPRNQFFTTLTYVTC